MEAHDFVLFCVPRSSLAHQGETVESVFLSVSVRTGGWRNCCKLPQL